MRTDQQDIRAKYVARQNLNQESDNLQFVAVMACYVLRQRRSRISAQGLERNDYPGGPTVAIAENSEGVRELITQC